MRGIDVGRYSIVSELGTGAMGTVYLAHDSGLDRDVALKVMLPDRAQDAELRQRFEGEAKTLAKIADPNVVAVFDHGYHQGAPYIVMELLHGKDLRRAVQALPVMDIDRRLEVVASVLRGLTAVHAAGIVHRDIKPANVFLCDDGSVKVVDFGIARLSTATMSAEGSIVGSPDYMSPEQVQGEQITERSDLFSVGSMLCELLGGAPPFRAENPLATLFKIVNGEPDFKGIPQDHRHAALLPILRKALAKAPESRYSSALEFGKALKALIQAPSGPLDRTLGVDTRQVDEGTLSWRLASHRTPETPTLEIAKNRPAFPAMSDRLATAVGGSHAQRSVSPSSLALEEVSYTLGQHGANAIRLVGAADESFPTKFVHVQYDPTPYAIPSAFRHDYKSRLERLKRAAEGRGSSFHDGPCARLVRLTASPRDHSERKHLQITLGPIGWFDFSVVDDRIHEATSLGRYGAFVSEFVDAGRIRAGDFRDSSLPSIVETMTAVVTADEELLYHERRGVSTVPDMLSTVSENIHRDKDDNLDQPGTPDISRTVIRGIEEELSPEIARRMSARDVLLTGLCYNLEELHPTFLFVARVPCDLRELLRICREWPGKDFAEGKLHSLPAYGEDPRWSTALASTWYASGKASVIRTLEFLDYGRRS